MLDNPLTFPELREDVLEVLSALAFRVCTSLTQSKTSQRLRPVARLWARVRPENKPAAGEPLRHALFGASPDLSPTDGRFIPLQIPDDEVQNPAQDARLRPGPDSHKEDSRASLKLPASLEVCRPASQPYARMPPRAERPLPPLETQLEDMSLAPGAKPRSAPDPGYYPQLSGDIQPQGAHTLPIPSKPISASILPTPTTEMCPSPQPLDPTERVANIYHESQVAKSNASVLFETLTYEGLDSPLVEEFSGKVKSAQDYLLSELPWATEYAEVYHEPDVSAGAEALLADVLDALSEVGEALALKERLHEKNTASPVRKTADDSDDIPYDPERPSEKALGKRRAIEDIDDQEAGSCAECPFKTTEAPVTREPSPAMGGEPRLAKPPLPAIPRTPERLGNALPGRDSSEPRA